MGIDLHDYGDRYCYNLLSASWRTRKASDLIQFQYKGSRTRNSNMQGQEDIGLSQEVREKICSSSALWFYLDLRLVEWCPPTWVRVGVLYSTY